MIIQKLMSLFIMTVMALTVSTMAAAPAYAACSSSNTSKGQIEQGIGEAGTDCSDSGVDSTLHAVLIILSYVAGVAAVIMIIIAGFRYITSNGDSGRISSAKTTLVYALVGLAVAALATALVHFVLNHAAHAS